MEYNLFDLLQFKKKKVLIEMNKKNLSILWKTITQMRFFR